MELNMKTTEQSGSDCLREGVLGSRTGDCNCFVSLYKKHWKMDSNLCAGITLDKNENLDFFFKPLGRNEVWTYCQAIID